MLNWSEYQDIVGNMFRKAEGIGNVRKNIYLPDKITGQARQIDAWIDGKIKGCELGILIDAKFYKSKINVKHVEEVLSLAEAVGAHKSILVAANGWTDPAKKKGRHFPH